MLVFVVDTEQYSGGFSREMAGYMTGICDEFGVAQAECVLYREQTGSMCIGKSNRSVIDGITDDDDLESDLVQRRQRYVHSDEDYGFQACEIWPTNGWFCDGMGGFFKHGKESEAEKHFRKAVNEYEKRYNTKLNHTMEKLPAYMSIGIYLRREPTDNETRELKDRAHQFAEFSSQNITITGFRLVEVERTIKERVI